MDYTASVIEAGLNTEIIFATIVTHTVKRTVDCHKIYPMKIDWNMDIFMNLDPKVIIDK